jgi:hypothetical protein
LNSLGRIIAIPIDPVDVRVDLLEGGVERFIVVLLSLLLRMAISDISFLDPVETR